MQTYLPGRLALVTAFTMSVVACSSGEPRRDRTAASIEETQAWLQAVQPQTVSSVTFRIPLRYDYLNNQYVTLDVRNSLYLIEFQRPCPALRYDASGDTVDGRATQGVLRRNDTIRGCRIGTIYRVPNVEREQTPDVEAETELDVEEEPQA